jgi:hypothetical protein
MALAVLKRHVKITKSYENKLSPLYSILARNTNICTPYSILEKKKKGEISSQSW